MRTAQPHGTGQAKMWGWAMGGVPLLLLLLLLPGAVGLQCLSCGAEDGTCHEATNVTCPPESDVCAEALASVTWSHGRLALGGRGCGRGQPGALARALELPGVVVFVRRRQCREGEGPCNGALPVGTERALPLPANVTAQAPNGLRCFGCPDDGPCSAPTIVECYGDLRACFHGNVTVTLGGSRRWREVRSCVRDPSCPIEPRGDEAVGLEGSCCAGDLCNGPIGNRSLFAPNLPRLELLPQPHGPTNGSAGGEKNSAKMAASTGNVVPTGANMAASIGSVVPTAAHRATGKFNMAATKPNMAATESNMAASRANMAATKPNMAATKPNMAATKPNMAATKSNMAASTANMAATKSNMAASTANMAATTGTLAAGNGNMATIGHHGAAIDHHGAAIDHHGAAIGHHGATIDHHGAAIDHHGAAIDASTAAMDSKMAAGRAGRPLERKDGAKGAVGRSHALGVGLWPLPFLLLLLL